MRPLIKFASGILLSVSAVSACTESNQSSNHDSHAQHNEKQPLLKLLGTETSEFSAGEISLKFELHQPQSDKAIADKDLDVSHEKKLHVIIFDPSLTQFRHIHPDFQDGAWQASVDLDTNGEYWLWAEGVLSESKDEFSTVTRFHVKGGKEALKPATELGEVPSGQDRGAVVSLSGSRFKAGKMVMPLVEFSKTDGSEAKISNYLGAPAHIVAANAEGQILHVHPMMHDGKFMLHATFPKAGDYRIWVQFIESGQLRLVPLSVTVEEG